MNYDIFYSSSKWQKKRKLILMRDAYMCINCKRYGIFKDALIVHHIEPLNDDLSNAYNNDNLISLCLSCHNKMHNRNNLQELSNFGKEFKKVYDNKLKRKR